MRKLLAIIFLHLAISTPQVFAQFGEWSVPYPTPVKTNPDTVTVHIIGDVMMHSTQFGRDYSTFFRELAPQMREADFSIANMEFTLAGQPYSGYPSFSAPEDIVWTLASQCGTDVFLTANNHISDRGLQGMSRTLDIYDSVRDSLDTRFTGTARSSSELLETYPLILRRRGVSIALVNFTYGTNNGLVSGPPSVNVADTGEVAGAMRRASEADFIIALPHWGEEYHLRPSSTQRQWAQWLVEQGADIIVGGHPHVVQDTTHIKGVPVIYSLGNAVSNMSITNSRLALAVTLTFVSDRTTGVKKMLEPELEFLWCTLPGMLLESSYATIPVKKWAGRRGDWLTPSDYDNMVATLERVKAATGIR